MSMQSHPPSSRPCAGRGRVGMFSAQMCPNVDKLIMYACTKQLLSTVFYESAMMVAVINLHMQSQSYYRYMY